MFKTFPDYVYNFSIAFSMNKQDLENISSCVPESWHKNKLWWAIIYLLDLRFDLDVLKFNRWLELIIYFVSELWLIDDLFNRYIE